MSALLLTLAFCGVADSEDDLPTIRGIDLNQHPIVDENKVAEFFETTSDASGTQRRVWRKTVFKMPLISGREQSAWLYYPAGTEHFYIRYRSSGNGAKTTRLFGPIDGEPFAMLKLEPEMIEKIKSGEGHDVPYRLKLMLKTEDQSLVRRAFRVLYRMTERNIEGYELEDNVKQVQRISTDYRKQLESHIRAEQLKRLDEKLAVAQAKIDSLVKEFPTEDYKRAKNVEPVVPATIDKSWWGEPVDGLRMALVPHESASSDYGKAIWVLVIVENTVKTPIKLSVSDVTQSVQLQALLPNKKSVRPNSVWHSGIAPIERFLIPPGERMVLGKFGLTAAEDRAAAEFGVSVVTEKPIDGKLPLDLTCTLPIGYGSAWSRDADNIMRRVSPAKGEYVGLLTTGKLKLTFLQRAK